MHDVRAIGLKCPGSEGLSLAASLGIRRITPFFQACGITPVSQHECQEEQAVVRNSVSECCMRCDPKDLGRRMISNGR